MKKFTFALCLILSSASLCFNAAAGWKKNQGDRTWWYQYSKGSYPKDKWEFIDNEWYYFDNEGYMVSDRWIGDYYLGSDGAMLKDTVTPDNYRVGADGAYIPGVTGLYRILSLPEDRYDYLSDNFDGFRYRQLNGDVLKIGGHFYINNTLEYSHEYLEQKSTYTELELIFSPNAVFDNSLVGIDKSTFLDEFIQYYSTSSITFHIVDGVIIEGYVN